MKRLFPIRVPRFAAADYLTSLAVLGGWAAVLLLLSGDPFTALVVNSLAILLDVIDGIVARRMGGGSGFGARLDAFSDVVNYLFFPSVLYFLAADGGRLWIGTGAALIVLFGLIRLAQLGDMQRVSGAGGNELVGLTVVHVYFTILFFFWAEELAALGLAWLFLPLAVALSFLMVSNLRVRKSAANYALMLALLAMNVGLSLWRMGS